MKHRCFMPADTRIRLPEDIYNQVKVIAGKTGQSEGDVVKDIIIKAESEGKTLEEIVGDMEAKVSAPRGRPLREGTRPTEVVVTHEGKSDPLDRMADKMEKVLSVKLMGSLIRDMDLTPDQRALLASRNPNANINYPQQQQQHQPRDFREVIADIKLIESIGGEKSDPAVKEMLKTLTDELRESRKQPPKEDTFNERLERIALLRTLGQDKEADNAIKELKRDFEGKVSDLQQKVDDQKEDIHKMQLAELKTDLTKRIEELQNRPDMLQQAKGIFELAEQDESGLMKEVVKAVAKKKLGIEEKKFSLKDLANDFNSIPIGKAKDFIVDIINAVRGTAKAPAPPPPQTSPPTTVEVSEQELAERAGISEQLPKLLSAEKGVTFAEPEEPAPAQPQPVEETALPPEEAESQPQSPSPPPTKGEEKPRQRRVKKE